VRTRFVAAAVLAGVLAAVPPLAADQAKPAGAPRLVGITVNDPVGEKMTYSLSTITAKPGERLRIRLFSLGKLPRAVMAHNWVLLALGTDPKKFAEAAALSPANGYIPVAMKSKILAQTEMVGPGEHSEVVFTAPAKPGSYPYLCTFAGHFAAGMSGTLIVK
jgi:azurin